MMRFLLFAMCVVALGCEQAAADAWQPTAGHTQIPIWPGTPPNDKPMSAPEIAGVVSKDVAGKPWTYVTHVANPTLTVYSPAGKNTGAAVVVFPGGGFEVLAIDLEGTEVCDWLTAKGITCILLKYRVPSEPYNPKCNCRTDNMVTSTRSLEDAQRTMGLVRLHAKEWHVDPHKVGVLGFSAGGYLAAEANTRYRHRLYAPIDDADKESARPDFAVLVYPGHLATDNDENSVALNRNVPVTADTPPAFLVQAEDDETDGVHQTLAYYIAAKEAGAPVEMHLYAQGGHAFGLRHTSAPITDWPRLVETWLHTIGMISE